MKKINLAEFEAYCYDCANNDVKTQMKFDEQGNVVNGQMIQKTVTEKNRDIKIRFKCKSCFEKNPKWEDLQECEVYSRVVDYLRPVSQWNRG